MLGPHGGPTLLDPSQTSTPASHWGRPGPGDVTLETVESVSYVAVLNDRIGAMHQRQPGANTTRPIYVASDSQYGDNPVLSSSGGRWLIGDAVTAIVAPVTLMVIGHATAMSSIISAGAGAEPVNLLWRKTSAGNAPIEFYSKFPGFSAVPMTGPTDGLIGSPALTLLVDTGTNTSLYVNNLVTPAVTLASSRWGSTTAMHLMMMAAGVTQLIGKLAEYALWRAAVNTDDRRGLGAYALNRYPSIPIILPP